MWQGWLWLLAAATPQAAERWAGHQVTVTQRNLPLIGIVETRQDVLMVADVVREGDTIRIVEQPCTIGIKSGTKVNVTFDPMGVRNIPPTTIVYRPRDGGMAAAWQGGWGEADVDKNGIPGFSVGVEAPVCTGTMSVASSTTNVSRATAADGGLNGSVRLELHRQIVGTDSWCLSLVPKRNEEVIEGYFSYRPVEASATCDSLLSQGWPVRASR